MPRPQLMPTLRLTALGLVTLVGASGCPFAFFDSDEAADCVSRGCDDGNACTIDLCDSISGRCKSTAVRAGVLCDNADVCDGQEQCDGQGQCQAGEPIDRDDRDECTNDLCDPRTGKVSHEPIPACVPGWHALPIEGAPSARYDHSAIWTGTEMLIWGGRTEESGAVRTASGARYDAKSDSWQALSPEGAPTAREGHSAIWTGTEMLIWGGFSDSGYEQSGGAYNPSLDSWRTITGSGAPAGRRFHSTVWTGESMLVWGGRGPNNLSSGGRYTPAAKSWSSIAGSGQPSARFNHNAVWTGDAMLIWGGSNTFDWLHDGRSYDPLGNAWPNGLTTSGAPGPREEGSAVWTGSQMLVWGGWNGGPYLDDGGSFTPSAGGGSWTALASTGAPSPRARHVAIWTGSEMVVWGGCGGQVCGEIRDDGGRYEPNGGGSWTAIEASPEIGSRRQHSGVWTGEEFIVWGGQDGDGPLASGARRRF